MSRPGDVLDSDGGVRCLLWCSARDLGAYGATCRAAAKRVGASESWRVVYWSDVGSEEPGDARESRRDGAWWRRKVRVLLTKAVLQVWDDHQADEAREAGERTAREAQNEYI